MTTFKPTDLRSYNNPMPHEGRKPRQQKTKFKVAGCHMSHVTRKVRRCGCQANAEHRTPTQTPDHRPNKRRQQTDKLHAVRCNYFFCGVGCVRCIQWMPLDCLRLRCCVALLCGCRSPVNSFGLFGDCCSYGTVKQSHSRRSFAWMLLGSITHSFVGS